MSHMIAVPDELYAKVAALAEERGESAERVVEALLSRGVGQGANNHPATLNWEAASAEEIIADVRASREAHGHPQLGQAAQSDADPGLSTLDPQTGRPYVASGELRGIGAGGSPPPTDEDIERWRREKYGEWRGGNGGVADGARTR